MCRISMLIAFQILFLGAGSAAGQTSTNPETADSSKIDWEVFPMITYDTDAGFGYGIKGYLRNLFNRNESYDAILYNSTEGERWYRFQFSYPDYEVRQGTDFGYAVDFIADYDKWISYYFYGIGNSSIYNDRKVYTREPFAMSIILSKALTSTFIFQTGIKYSIIKVVNFPETLLPENNNFSSSTDNLSIQFGAVYDTRNSVINPSDGINISAGFESSVPFSFVNPAFSNASLSILSYHSIIFKELIFAERVSLQQLIGNDIPIQFLLPVGGNQTLRGYSQDRFLDKSSAYINAEFRFPIWWKFGGIAGIDAGRVFSSLNKFSLSEWKICPAAGLRFYKDNFVVRADFGFSKETTGFYFNFGHLF